MPSGSDVERGESQAEVPVGRRQALLVLGMHRSGTSALSGVLVGLGVQPPKSLMNPAKDNPRGFWESTTLAQFHDEILASVESAWDDWGGFNSAWIDSPIAAGYLERLPSLIEQEFEGATIFLVKDPRVCRLMPLWSRVLDDMGIELKVVLPIRHPWEVARSLEARNQFSTARSQLIWLRHVLDSEASTRHASRAFLRYSDMLGDWRVQMRKLAIDLDIEWPKWSDAVEAEIDEYLSAELRHFVAGQNEATGYEQLDRWVQQAYEAIQRLVDDGSDRHALQAMDAIRGDFDRSTAVFSAVMQETRSESVKKMASLRQRVEKLSGQVKLVEAARQKLVSGRQEELASLAERAKAREEEHAQMLSKHHSRHASLVGELKARDQEIEELHARQEAKIEEMKALHTRETNRLFEVKRQLEESLQARFAEMASGLEQTIKEQAGELSKAADSVSDLARNVQLLREEREKSDTQILAMEIELKNQVASRERLEHEHAAKLHVLDQEIDLHRKIAAGYRDRLRSLLASRAWKIVSLLRGEGWLTPGTTLDEAPESGLEADDLIRKSGLFDPIWYLGHYPDVAGLGMDPIRHYLHCGAAEGRDPGPGFNTRGYLIRYPEVAASGVNPLLHYIQYGLREGRIARESKKTGD